MNWFSVALLALAALCFIRAFFGQSLPHRLAALTEIPYVGLVFFVLGLLLLALFAIQVWGIPIP